MKDLNYYKEKIKAKRKETSFRDFLMEVASWYPLVLNKRGYITRYPDTVRSPILTSSEIFSTNIDNNLKFGIKYNFSKNFFDNFKDLFQTIPLANIHEFRNDSENSQYADIISSSKNVYLSFNVTR